MSQAQARPDGSRVPDPDDHSPNFVNSSPEASEDDSDDTVSTAGSAYSNLPAGEHGPASHYEMKRYVKKRLYKAMDKQGQEFSDYSQQMHASLGMKDWKFRTQKLAYKRQKTKTAKVKQKLAREKESHRQCQTERDRLATEVTSLKKTIQDLEAALGQPDATVKPLMTADADATKANEALDEAEDEQNITNTVDQTKSSKNPNKKRKVAVKKHLYSLQLLVFHSTADPSQGSQWNVRDEGQVRTNATSRQLDSLIKEMKVNANMNSQQMTGRVWFQDFNVEGRVQMKLIERENWPEWCKEVTERDNYERGEQLPLMKAYMCRKEQFDVAAQSMGQ